MTAVDVKLGDEVYTVTLYGWSGPDPKWVETLNLAYPPTSTIAADRAVWAALDVARDFVGEVIAQREVPDPEPA